jgi:hypothetical protein
MRKVIVAIALIGMASHRFQTASFAVALAQ